VKKQREPVQTLEQVRNFVKVRDPGTVQARNSWPVKRLMDPGTVPDSVKGRE
jgi:hypothetical protein